MRSIKLKFRLSAALNNEGYVIYQVSNGHSTKTHRSEHHFPPQYWDAENNTMIIDDSENREVLEDIKQRIEYDIRSIEYTFYLFEKKDYKFNAEDVVKFYEKNKYDFSVFNYMNKIIAQLKAAGQTRTSETYTTALFSFSRFWDKKDIFWKDMTRELIENYENYLSQRGVTRNSSSFYMRILRAVYNRAVREGLALRTSPFETVYTGVDKTVKHALSLQEMKRMINKDYSRDPKCDLARDFFVFSFCTRGMNFKDMANLKKTDLKNGILTYEKHIGQQIVSIKWENCMQRIIEKHPTPESSPYMLPIISEANAIERIQYKNMMYKINNMLKIIGNDIGLDFPLAFGMAKHSWANIANSKDIDISVISKSLGIDSIKETQLYLDSISCNLVNDANSSILDEILQ